MSEKSQPEQADRLAHLAREGTREEVGEGTDQGVESAPLLEARGIWVRYGDLVALADLSLSVAAGEILAVLGPNGAGKTSLLRVLSGVRAPDAGAVHLLGEPIAHLPRRELARRLAVVAQAERVVFGFGVRDVVMMGRAPHQGGWLGASRDDVKVVDDALEACDLTALAHRPADTLSGGEQKRMQIARALAQRPRVLLLDEPAASLDVGHQIAVHDLIAHRVREDKIACVVVMHDLALAARYATRVALFAHGRVLAHGTPDEVLTAKLLGEAFHVDIESGRHGPSGARYFVAGAAHLTESPRTAPTKAV